LKSKPLNNLLFIFFFIIFSNRVELQSVLVLFNSNKSDPISDLVLFQVSLGQVFQVFTTEFGVWNNNNLVTFRSNRNFITQVSNNIVNFDVFNQVLDVTFLVKNTIFNWSWSVNDEFFGSFGFLSGLKKVVRKVSLPHLNNTYLKFDQCVKTHTITFANKVSAAKHPSHKRG